jgi:hypothetical protein
MLPTFFEFVQICNCNQGREEKGVGSTPDPLPTPFSFSDGSRVLAEMFVSRGSADAMKARPAESLQDHSCFVALGAGRRYSHATDQTQDVL